MLFIFRNLLVTNQLNYSEKLLDKHFWQSVAIYKKDFEPQWQKAKIWFKNHLERHNVFGENRLPMEDVTQWFSEMGIGLLLLQQMGKCRGFWSASFEITGKSQVEKKSKKRTEFRHNGQSECKMGKQPLIKWFWRE